MATVVDNSDLLSTGIRCYELFLQANWTGPTPSRSSFPDIPSEFVSDSGLDIDGEQLYIGCVFPELLVSSIRIFDHLARDPTRASSVGFWRARAYFTWQRVLADSTDRGQGQCPSLMRVCLNEYCVALSQYGYISCEASSDILEKLSKSSSTSSTPLVLPEASSVEMNTRIERILELVVRLAYYNKIHSMTALIAQVSDLLGISFSVTGVEGIRRENQTKSFAQMTTLVKRSTDGVISTSVSDEPLPVPKALVIADFDVTTDIFESVKYSDENRSEITSKLNSLEQCLLIVEALRIYYSGSSRDELNMESVQALVMRIISTSLESPPCWIAFSMCLLLRSRCEFFRNATRGRACFQVDALVEQFREPEPGSSTRLDLIHCTGYPSLWELQRENGLRMMEVGMVMTACEMFKKLQMWPLALDCLAVAGRKTEALELLDTLEPLDPRLLCSKGDMTGVESFYAEAWEKSNHTCARAQRSLGRVYMKKGQLEEAAAAFETSLVINPLFDDIWYSLGSIYLKLDDGEKAATALVRCVGVNPEHVNAWVNLSAVFSRSDNIEEAKKAAEQAVKLAPHSWQFWENYGLLSARCEDWNGVLRAEKKLTFDIQRTGHPDEQILSLLRAKITQSFQKQQLLAFVEDIVLRNKHSFTTLRMLADMYMDTGRSEDAFKTHTVLLKEIVTALQDPESAVRKQNKTTVQDIIDDLIICLAEVKSLLMAHPGLSAPGLGLTMRSLPRRVAAANNGNPLPRVSDLCSEIATIVSDRSRLDE